MILSVRPGEGETNQKSNARARCNNPQFSWWPSATMLEYRRSGTIEGTVSNRNGRAKYFESLNFTLVETNGNAPHSTAFSRRAVSGFSTTAL